MEEWNTSFLLCSSTANRARVSISRLFWVLESRKPPKVAISMVLSFSCSSPQSPNLWSGLECENQRVETNSRSTKRKTKLVFIRALISFAFAICEKRCFWCSVRLGVAGCFYALALYECSEHVAPAAFVPTLLYL